jgi:hypothetical protein
MGAAHRLDLCGRAGRLAGHPTDRRDQLGVVSWAATASARMVESTARRRRPATIPVSSTTCLTASLMRCGLLERASRWRQ